MQRLGKLKARVCSLRLSVFVNVLMHLNDAELFGVPTGQLMLIDFDWDRRADGWYNVVCSVHEAEFKPGVYVRSDLSILEPFGPVEWQDG